MAMARKNGKLFYFYVLFKKSLLICHEMWYVFFWHFTNEKGKKWKSYAWYFYITLIFWNIISGYTNKEIKQICQRCQLNIIESDGIYNLLVEDVRLGDDEYFECQVSPGKGAINSVPLRAPVHITIQGKKIFSKIAQYNSKPYWL